MLYLGPNEVTELKKVKTVIVNGQVNVHGSAVNFTNEHFTKYNN